MSIIVNDSLENRSNKPLLSFYLDGSTPWADVATAKLKIPPTYRHKGLTILVGPAAPEEYWWRDDTIDDQLVLKGAGSQAGPAGPPGPTGPVGPAGPPGVPGTSIAVVDSLLSQSASDALSANQGYVLQRDKINNPVIRESAPVDQGDVYLEELPADILYLGNIDAVYGGLNIHLGNVPSAGGAVLGVHRILRFKSAVNELVVMSGAVDFEVFRRRVEADQVIVFAPDFYSTQGSPHWGELPQATWQNIQGEKLPITRHEMDGSEVDGDVEVEFLPRVDEARHVEILDDADVGITVTLNLPLVADSVEGQLKRLSVIDKAATVHVYAHRENEAKMLIRNGKMNVGDVWEFTFAGDFWVPVLANGDVVVPNGRKLQVDQGSVASFSNTSWAFSPDSRNMLAEATAPLKTTYSLSNGNSWPMQPYMSEQAYLSVAAAGVSAYMTMPNAPFSLPFQRKLLKASAALTKLTVTNFGGSPLRQGPMAADEIWEFEFVDGGWQSKTGGGDVYLAKENYFTNINHFRGGSGLVLRQPDTVDSSFAGLYFATDAQWAPDDKAVDFYIGTGYIWGDHIKGYINTETGEYDITNRIVLRKQAGFDFPEDEGNVVRDGCAAALNVARLDTDNSFSKKLEIKSGGTLALADGSLTDFQNHAWNLSPTSRWGLDLALRPTRVTSPSLAEGQTYYMGAQVDVQVYLDIATAGSSVTCNFPAWDDCMEGQRVWLYVSKDVKSLTMLGDSGGTLGVIRKGAMRVGEFWMFEFYLGTWHEAKENPPWVTMVNAGDNGTITAAAFADEDIRAHIVITGEFPVTLKLPGGVECLPGQRKWLTADAAVFDMQVVDSTAPAVKLAHGPMVAGESWEFICNNGKWRKVATGSYRVIRMEPVEGQNGLGVAQCSDNQDVRLNRPAAAEPDFDWFEIGLPADVDSVPGQSILITSTNHIGALNVMYTASSAVFSARYGPMLAGGTWQFLFAGGKWASVLPDSNIAFIRVRSHSEISETFGVNDLSGYVRSLGDDPVSMAVPSDAYMQCPIGSCLTARQVGTGVITVMSMEAGVVTIHGGPKSAGPGKSIQLIKVGANEWDAVGGVE